MKSLSLEFLNSIGVSEFGYTEESIPHSLKNYQDWVKNQNHGILNYLADHRQDLRADIKNIFPEFQSALVFLFPYEGARKDSDEKVASYAFAFEGADYHDVLRKRLEVIIAELKREFGEFKYSMSIDMQPVLERDLAYRAGLGWFGKNSMLINRKHGSYFLIASLFLDRKINAKQTYLENDHCGTCSACVEACPTQAIDPTSRTLKANLCLSTFTIEQFKEAEPPSGFQNSRGEIFGCDICQDVCPWNSKPLERAEKKSRGDLSLFFARSHQEIFEDINKMSLSQFKRFFAGSVFLRTGKRGILKSIKAWLTSSSQS
jgi:epoxyqueuosine reductase